MEVTQNPLRNDEKSYVLIFFLDSSFFFESNQSIHYNKNWIRTVDIEELEEYYIHTKIQIDKKKKKKKRKSHGRSIYHQVNFQI